MSAHTQETPSAPTSVTHSAPNNSQNSFGHDGHPYKLEAAIQAARGESAHPTQTTSVPNADQNLSREALSVFGGLGNLQKNADAYNHPDKPSYLDLAPFGPASKNHAPNSEVHNSASGNGANSTQTANEQSTDFSPHDPKTWGRRHETLGSWLQVEDGGRDAERRKASWSSSRAN